MQFRLKNSRTITGARGVVTVDSSVAAVVTSARSGPSPAAAAAPALKAAAASAEAAAAAATAVPPSSEREAKKRRTTGPKGTTGTDAVKSAFGLQAAMEAAEQEAREAAAAMAKSAAAAAEAAAAADPVARRAEAQSLRKQGEKVADRGDFPEALCLWSKGLAALQPLLRSAKVAAVAVSGVAKEFLPGAAVALEASTDGAAGAKDEEQAASQKLAAKLHEAIAQILQDLPEDKDPWPDIPAAARNCDQCGKGKSAALRRAVSEAQQAVGLAPGWAPAHLTLGRALLAAGHAHQARQAFKRAEELDADFFASEGGAADVSDALKLDSRPLSSAPSRTAGLDPLTLAGGISAGCAAADDHPDDAMQEHCGELMQRIGVKQNRHIKV